MIRFGVKIKKKKIIRTLAALMVIVFLFSSGAIPEFNHASAYVFYDVEDHWAQSEIERLFAIGLIKGISEDMFAPDSDINRAEFLTLVNRLFGATATANISQFTDVQPQQWYYSEIAKAYQMGTTIGNGNGLMQPLNPVTREQAAIIIARVMCLPAGNNSALFAFEDREQIAAYSRDYVAAMVIEGYMDGRGSNFEPAENLTRAEAAVVLNNIIGDLYSQSGTYAANCDGNLIITVSNMYIRNAVIKGDVIIGDGVGQGEVTLENCSVGGRLIVRGGGENSVYLNGTRVQGDTYIMNNNYNVHIATSNDSYLGRVIANSGCSLSGGGVKSVFIGDKMKENSSVDLSGCDYESLDVMSPRTMINLSDGSIGNVKFSTNSSGSSLYLASNTSVQYLSINAPNVNVSGRGGINAADIGAYGAVLEVQPGSVKIADSITAKINGSDISGQPSSPTGSNSDRAKAVPIVDSGFTVTVTPYTDGSTVTLTQKASSVGLEASKTGRTRLAYWVRIFLPAPDSKDSNGDERTSGYASTFTYTQDGGYVTRTNYALGYQNGVLGLEYYVPVTRNGPSLNGTINDDLFIRWDTGHYEKIYLRSKTISLKELSSTQELELINLYNRAEFYAYDGTKYSGTEAIRRLLATENTLGLDVGAFPALPDDDKQYVSAAVNAVRDTFVTKAAIQSSVYKEVFGKGALYAVNRAMTIEQIRAVLENKNYAAEIGIDISNTSKYMKLSSVGRLSVANELYTGRGNDFTDIQVVREMTNAAIDRVWIEENNLLNLINAVRTSDEMQTLLENPTNALALGIITDADPYKKLSAEEKKAVMADMLVGKVYSGLESVRDRFDGNVIGPSVIEDEESKEPKITIKGIIATPSKSPSPFAAGNKFDSKIEVTIQTTTDKTTTTGKMLAADVAKLSFSWEWKTNPTNPIADVAINGDIITIIALREGSDTLTLTESESGLTCTISVTINPPVNATGISLNKTTTNLLVGGTEVLIATLIGATAKEKPTDNVQWSSDNPTVATVDQSGLVRGLKKGRAIITASISNPNGIFMANCEVWVFNDEYDIIISPDSITIVEGSSYQVQYNTYRPITSSGNVYIQWVASNEDIATVSSSGLVRAVGVVPGSGGNVIKNTTITANIMVNNNLSGSSSIEVIVEDRSSIKLQLTNAIMFQGDEQALDFTRLKDPDTGKDILPYMPGQQFIWELKGTSVSFVVGGNVTSGTSVTTAAIISAVPSIQATGVGRTYISVKTSEGQQPIHTIEVVSVPRTVQGMRFYKGTEPKAENEIRNISGFGSVLEIFNDQTQQVIATEQDGTGRVMTWETFEVDQFRKIGKPVTVNGKIPLPSPFVDKPIYDVLDSDGKTVVEEGLYDTDGAVRLSDTFTFQDYQKLIEQPYIDKSSNILLASNGLVAPQNNKTGLAAVRVTPARDSERENESLSNGTTIPWVDFWYDVVSLFVEDPSGNMVVNPNIIKESHFILEKYDAVNGWTRVGGADQYVTENMSEVSYAEVQAGTQRITDANGNILAAKTTPNPNLRAVVKEASSNGSNVFYVWVKAKDVQIEFKGITSTVVPGDRPLNSNNPFDVTVDFTVIQGSDDLKNSDEEFSTTNPDTRFDRYEYFIVTSIDEVTKRGNRMYLWPQVKQLLGGADTKIGSQGMRRFGFNYTAFAQVQLTSVGSYSITVKVTQVGNQGFARVNSGGGQNTQRQEAKMSEAEQEHIFSITQAPVTPVSGVSLSPPILTLGVGAERMLTATITPSNATNKDVVWESSNIDVAVVDQNGKVEAVSPGTATITVTTDDGSKKATCVVTVPGVTLNKTGTTLGLGRSETLAATVISTDSNKNVTWSSSNLSIATVDSTGRVTAVAVGDAVITAKAVVGGYEAKCVVTVVPVAVDAVILNKTTLELLIGATETLTATIEPSDATNKTITWASSDGAIATVADGLVTAVAEGTATITVTTADGGHTAECVVTVTAPVTPTGALMTLPIVIPAQSGVQSVPPPDIAEIDIKRTSATVIIGNSLTLPVDVTPEGAEGEIIWESSNEKAATVKNGVVTALEAGRSVITATANGVTSKCTVTVKEKPKTAINTITLSKEKAELVISKTLRLTANIRPTNATIKTLYWYSSDESVATVSQSGLVTARNSGKATIYAVTDDGGKTAKCELTVPPKAEGIELDQTEVTVKRLKTVTLKATVLPEDAADKSVTWKSSNTKVVTVDKNGKIKGVKAGAATITVTTKDGGFIAQCVVTVVP